MVPKMDREIADEEFLAEARSWRLRVNPRAAYAMLGYFSVSRGMISTKLQGL